MSKTPQLNWIERSRIAVVFKLAAKSIHESSLREATETRCVNIADVSEKNCLEFSVGRIDRVSLSLNSRNRFSNFYAGYRNVSIRLLWFWPFKILGSQDFGLSKFWAFGISSFRDFQSSGFWALNFFNLHQIFMSTELRCLGLLWFSRRHPTFHFVTNVKTFFLLRRFFGLKHVSAERNERCKNLRRFVLLNVLT